MAATYDITSHPLLSEKAKALLADDATAFDAVVVAVERTLGLHGTDFTDEDREDAKLAIVYQLNYELEQSAESSVYTRIDRRDRTWQYKSNLDAIINKARVIVDRLLDDPDDGGSARNYSSTAVKNEMVW